MHNTHCISDPLLQDMIENTHLPKTIFTQKLKAFYKDKKCTASYECLIEPKDAIALLLTLRTKVSDPSIHQDDQYNSARLIRLSLSWKLRESIFADIFVDMLAYIEKNTLHNNGNVRNETLFLLRDFLFLIDMLVGPRYPRKSRNKKEQAYADIFFPPLITYHKQLVLQEHEYIQKHRDKLSLDDIGYDGGFIPYSGDTHDKILARIRRILECMDYPYIMRNFETYGYVLYEKDDGISTSNLNKEYSERLRSPLIDPKNQKG